MNKEAYTYEEDFAVEAEDFARAGECSSRVKSLLKQLGINPDLVRRVCIAAYEAEINMIIHSLGGEMIFGISGDCIDIICRDNGPGIADIDLAMREGYSTASESARLMGFGAGMGLPNISRNADDFDIRSSPKGTTMQMRFHL